MGTRHILLSCGIILTEELGFKYMNRMDLSMGLKGTYTILYDITLHNTPISI
jgi:hypothetical protein